MAETVLEGKAGRDPVAAAPLCSVCGHPEGECPIETRIFPVENLDCAHCAAEMEERVAEIPRVDKASLTYTTKQLRVTCPHPDEMRLVFQDACRSVDADVVVCEASSNASTARRPAAAAAEVARAADDAGSRRDGACIISSALLFAIGLVLENFFPAVPAPVAVASFIAAYLAVGAEVLLHAARNIARGRVFDENLLMSVATFGAIAVQQFPEAVGVMLFYRIGELFEDRAVLRSRSQIMDAVDMRPETVERLIGYAVDDVSSAADGSVDRVSAHARRSETVPAEEARVGDLLLVKPGERIPLDGVVVEGSSRIDASPVTGEPVPVTVVAGSSVVSGCVNMSGLVVMRAEKALSESMVTRILDSVENASASKPQVQRFITRFARVYTPVVIAVAALTAVVPSLITGEWGRWVYTACTFLVISCPCAIVLSVPLSFFAGIGAAGKEGILFKGGNAIEALKGIRTAVMDKTGTITEGDFEVRRVEPASGFSEDGVLAAAAAAERASTHPIASSIMAEARRRSLDVEAAAAVEERPGKGLSARVAREGAPDRIIVCGNALMLEECHVPDDVPRSIADAAGTCVFVAVDGRYAGAIVIADEPKEDSAAAIETLRRQGIHAVMLTGDSPEAARAVADRVGIEDVRARLLPEQKLDELLAIRARDGAVMFVGDGINDAPVLAGADVGVAMGGGSDAAIEAADVVLMRSSLQAIPLSLRISREVWAIAMQNIAFALAVKATVMVLGFSGAASMWAAVFADVGVTMLCILNSIRLLHRRF